MMLLRRTTCDERRRLVALSPRERQVLSVIAHGRSAKGIAPILRISR